MSKGLPSIFGKFEYPKYDDGLSDTDNNGQKKVESKTYFKVILCFFLTILSLVYIIPENVLEIKYLKYFVDCISIIIPSVSVYDKLSKFPQIAKLVYSLCVITIPIQVLLIHKVLGAELANYLNKKTRDELNVAYCMAIFFLLIPLSFIYILPLIGPKTSILLSHYHTLKVSFSIITALAFFLNAIVVSKVISCREQIKASKAKNN